MDIKKLLKKEIPLPINTIKKPFIVLCGLKKYLSFNLISFIGLVDLYLFIYVCILAADPKNYGLGLPIALIGYSYFITTRIISLFLLLIFIIEKVIKFKIKQNFFMDNIIFNFIYMLGIISYILATLFCLYICIPVWFFY